MKIDMRNITLNKEQWKKFSAGLTTKHRIYSLSYSNGFFECRFKFVG